MKVATNHNNWARGKLDHDLSGRFDLPIHNSGADVFRNCISNFKGNAIYRPGFEEMLPFQDCGLLEFRYSDAQNYLLAGYASKIRFASYDGAGDFGWVLDGASNELEVNSPYTLDQVKKIVRSGQHTQNGDVMIVTHSSHEPYKLTRLTANSFTFRPYARKFDPFPTAWAATKAITGVTKATEAVLTITGHGYAVGDRIKLAAIVGMTELNDWTAAVIEVVNANSVKVDVDTSTFTAYTSGGTAAKVTAGSYPACSLFYKTRLYYAASLSRPTRVWGSEAASYFNHTLPVTPTDLSALQFDIAEISEAIDWLFGGDNSMIAGSGAGIVVINGGEVGAAITAETYEATLTSAPPSNDVYPVRKDGFVFYIGKDGRNLYHIRYDLLSEAFEHEDINFLSYDITKGGISKLRHKKDRNDLLICRNATTGYPLTLNYHKGENITGWHEHPMTTPNAVPYGTVEDVAVITNNAGKPQFFALNKYGSSYYIERQGELVEFVRRIDFYSGSESDDEQADYDAYRRYIAEQLKQCIYLDNANVVSGLQEGNAITYDEGAGTITAASPVFDADDVGKHIVYKTATGYESGRFRITAYTSTTVVEVEVLQEPTAAAYDDWYLTFSSISGLAQYDGTTVSLVADGGYVSDYEVAGGEVDIGTQVTHAVIGYRYRGHIMSFPLGFQVQGANTQVTMKAITRSWLRTVASAGGKFGSSLYHLEDVQELVGDELNYLPPLPIDGTKDIGYTDDHSVDKFYHIVQDLPLPFHCVGLVLAAAYAFES